MVARVAAESSRILLTFCPTVFPVTVVVTAAVMDAMLAVDDPPKAPFSLFSAVVLTSTTVASAA
jgi:hypothetical protein